MVRPSPTLCGLCLLGALWVSPALAQVGPDDSGVENIPDASVGSGGVDQEQQEGDDSTGRVPTTCTQDHDCSRAFHCVKGRCEYAGSVRANGGCLGVAPATVLGVALGLAFVRRRGKR